MSISTTSFLKNSVLVIGWLSICLAATAQSPADIYSRAKTQHGGTALNAVSSVLIAGESVSRNGNMPITITADLAGSIRFDYGLPVERSVVRTSQGEFEIRGTATKSKQPHVGLYAGLDLLSIFGLRRLDSSGITWADTGSAVDSGRVVKGLAVRTGQQQRHYGRLLQDEFEIAFDMETGLISNVRRMQYADNSLDLIFPVVHKFSDYMTVNGIILPFRIDKYVQDHLVETITVSRIQLNPSLSSTAFAR